MARVAYDRPFSQVGFRPYRYTQPYAAAHQLRGLGSLGDDSSTLASLGFSSGQIQSILAAHASGALSDNGYTFLLQGGVPPSDLANFLAQDPGSTDITAPIAVPAAGVPTGSILLYQATVDAHTWIREASVVSGIAGTLTANGIQITSQATGDASGLGNFTVQFQLQVVNSGFARPQDVQSVVDHAVYIQTGNMPLSSTIAIQSTPNTPGAGALPPTSPLGSLNWTEVLLGVAGIAAAAILARSFV